MWPALQWSWDTGAASVISKSMAAQVCPSRTGSQRHGGDIDGQHQQDAYSRGTDQPRGQLASVMLFQASLVLAAGHRRLPPDGMAQDDVSSGSYSVVACATSKYGALSDASGQIDLTWRVDRHGVPPHLKLRWKERDGPSVAPPVRHGFGTRLIERGLTQDLGGQARIAFASAGVVCTSTPRWPSPTTIPIQVSQSRPHYSPSLTTPTRMPARGGEWQAQL